MKTGHFYVSFVKSIIRIGGSIVAIITGSVFVLGLSFLVAELLGILEEIVEENTSNELPEKTNTDLPMPNAKPPKSTPEYERKYQGYQPVGSGGPPPPPPPPPPKSASSVAKPNQIIEIHIKDHTKEGIVK